METFKIVELNCTDWAGKAVTCYRVIEHCGSYNGEDLWLPHIELYGERENAEAYIKNLELRFP